jgi:NADH-quinone oxidoreductase subunit L
MCGVPFLSGFWSKDAILLEAGRIPWVQALLVLGAVMTTCYILRVYFRVFHGPEAQREHARSHGKSGRHHLHESPAVMLIPMSILGVGAAIAGFAGSPWFYNPFFRLLGDSHAHEHIDIPMLLTTLGILAAGGSLAWFVGFQRRNLLPALLRPIGRLLYMLAYNKYYVDEIYSRFIVSPIAGFARAGSIFDARVVDGVVNGAGRLGWLLSQAQGAFDRIVVDGIVNGVAAAAQAFGSGGRSIQNGIIQHYLLITIIAVITLSWLIRR